MEERPNSSYLNAARIQHNHSASLADLRPRAGNGNGNGLPVFGQQQQPYILAQPGAPGTVNNGSGIAMHRRSGTTNTSGGAILTRESAAGTKNTSHVPCKFFKEGKCQAGRGCQFSHAIESFQSPTPCKYFVKGNCKYGYRCANPHLLPDGRDARHAGYQQRSRQPFGDRGSFSLGPPAHPGFQESMIPDNFAQPGSPPMGPMYPNDDLSTSPPNRLNFNPPVDPAYNNFSSGMQYVSPQNESRHQPISPPIRALDAPIPPTFQSDPQLNTALVGPVAASVPSRLGFGFGPSSATTSTANFPAFGNLGYMARPETNGTVERPSASGSSPPTLDEGAFAKRILHSDRFRQQQAVASSLPMSRMNMNMNIHHDLSSDSDDEESFDLIPGNLGDEIMTPAEKLRRFSRTHDDGSSRQSLSGMSSGLGSKYGSPPTNMSASPSRWGPFNIRKRDDQDQAPYGSSPHGPVGSPLRNSSLHPDAARQPLHPEASPSIRPIARPPSSHLSGDVSPFGMHSPPDRRGAAAVGMLSQQFRNTRLRDQPAESGAAQTSLRPLAARNLSGGNPLANAGSGGRIDRAVSSGSIVRSDRIDEEAGVFGFEMDEEAEQSGRQSLERHSGESRRSDERPHAPRGKNPWNVNVSEGTSEKDTESGRSSPGSGGKPNPWGKRINGLGSGR